MGASVTLCVTSAGRGRRLDIVVETGQAVTWWKALEVWTMDGRLPPRVDKAAEEAKTPSPNSKKDDGVADLDRYVAQQAAELPAEYTDLKDGGQAVLGKSGVQTFKAGWTDDKPAVPAVS